MVVNYFKKLDMLEIFAETKWNFIPFKAKLVINDRLTHTILAAEQSEVCS